MAASSVSEISRTRAALLAYAARFGVTDSAAQRLLAARLWRAAPRRANAAQVVAAAEQLIGAWASQRVGFPLTAAQLRLAVLETGADAQALLGDEDAAAFTATIAPALPQAVPLEIRTVMPVQSLAKASFFGALRPAAVAAHQSA